VGCWFWSFVWALYSVKWRGRDLQKLSEYPQNIKCLINYINSSRISMLWHLFEILIFLSHLKECIKFCSLITERSYCRSLMCNVPEWNSVWLIIEGISYVLNHRNSTFNSDVPLAVRLYHRQVIPFFWLAEMFVCLCSVSGGYNKHALCHLCQTAVLHPVSGLWDIL
jgi:hypothetical protein